MFPEVLHKQILNDPDCYYADRYEAKDDRFTITSQHKNYFHKFLGVKNEESNFILFFSVVASPRLGKGDEIYPLAEIVRNIEYCKEAVDDGELPESIGTRYLRFTSIEGGGSYYYDVETDAVYDCDFGEEWDMASGEKKPWFTSFHDFLEWYYSE